MKTEKRLVNLSLNLPFALQKKKNRTLSLVIYNNTFANNNVQNDSRGLTLLLRLLTLIKKVKESWARGVEWELTRMIYPSSEYKGREFNRGDYTLVVADMIDGSATSSTRINKGYIDANDQVSGYTIKQIEDQKV